MHKIFVYTIIFGFLLPKKYLKFHALLWPLTYLHWKTNNDKCAVTQLEKYLKGDKNVPTVENDHDDGDANFMKRFFKGWGINLTMRGIHTCTLIIFTVSWLITMYRLLF
uniref:Uncharacterized protein n=1 Tax=Mimivirus LCMiAC01 TaxID=2506608 RepID=A0A481Z075_9VIRU|nr:MAG: uncharacterized protein LCMiAC01_05850 [Mimivirus LCMiAC01]